MIKYTNSAEETEAVGALLGELLEKAGINFFFPAFNELLFALIS